MTVTQCAKRAAKRWGLVKRSCKSPKLGLAMYKALVRPLVETSTAVWDPTKSKLSDEIERIQQRVTRAITPGLEYHERNVKSSLDPLWFRRILAGLMQYHRMSSEKKEGRRRKERVLKVVDRSRMFFSRIPRIYEMLLRKITQMKGPKDSGRLPEPSLQRT
ncbi:hypothetical protein Ciccas_004268 [Cichlidogyrus casuarinus]|uniref:Uncharacterized protein n=1 Tax=Cichlidogyrus casuarinus TaxID=1844966 RepID=A0ABD2QC22_9PLAT